MPIGFIQTVRQIPVPPELINISNKAYIPDVQL